LKGEIEKGISLRFMEKSDDTMKWLLAVEISISTFPKALALAAAVSGTKGPRWLLNF
jgi:hypothetical protein